MTNSTTSTGARPTELAKADAGALTSGQGSTTIADTVVSKVAGLATREVSGVHALGGGAARAVGALRERTPGASASVSRESGSAPARSPSEWSRTQRRSTQAWCRITADRPPRRGSGAEVSG